MFGQIAFKAELDKLKKEIADLEFSYEMAGSDILDIKHSISELQHNEYADTPFARVSRLMEQINSSSQLKNIRIRFIGEGKEAAQRYALLLLCCTARQRSDIYKNADPVLIQGCMALLEKGIYEHEHLENLSNIIREELRGEAVISEHRQKSLLADMMLWHGKEHEKEITALIERKGFQISMEKFAMKTDDLLHVDRDALLESVKHVSNETVTCVLAESSSEVRAHILDLFSTGAQEMLAKDIKEYISAPQEEKDVAVKDFLTLVNHNLHGDDTQDIDFIW
ncbi:FliG C-terminal domain-containing protein [Maridesulfovibrio zosterae]|uniref:FliG C-terminal domain-containing protein n=1 Tax=Maridesulfovibrio zosterae TaxID=82171 RepID=UPI0003F8DFC3|nr:FliG C-terminal domain-containing protein [Maridesulfovibrio zosterae]